MVMLKAKGISFIKMGTSLKATSTKIKQKDRENINMPMEDTMKV